MWMFLQQFILFEYNMKWKVLCEYLNLWIYQPWQFQYIKLKRVQVENSVYKQYVLVHLMSQVHKHICYILHVISVADRCCTLQKSKLIIKITCITHVAYSPVCWISLIQNRCLSIIAHDLYYVYSIFHNYQIP